MYPCQRQKWQLKTYINTATTCCSELQAQFWYKISFARGLRWRSPPQLLECQRRLDNFWPESRKLSWCVQAWTASKRFSITGNYGDFFSAIGDDYFLQNSQRNLGILGTLWYVRFDFFRYMLVFSVHCGIFRYIAVFLGTFWYFM